MRVVIDTAQVIVSPSTIKKKKNDQFLPLPEKLKYLEN